MTDGQVSTSPRDATRPAAAVASYPPRYGWTKRLALLGVVLAVVFAAAWVAWRHEARRRLARELAVLAARGEAIEPAEFSPPSLPDEENAAYYFRQAAAAIRPGVDSPASSVLEYEDYPPYPPQWHRLADGNVAAHGQVFAWERRARPHPRAQWGDPGVPLLVRYSSPLNRLRHMAVLTGDAALHQHVHGDDAAALELIRDMRHLARGIDQQPVLVTHMVAFGVDLMMLYRVQIIATDLPIAPDDEPPTPPEALLPSTRPSARAASRAQIRALISDLLADAESTEPLRRALVGERAFMVHLIQEVARDDRLLRPMFDLDAARLLGAQPPVTRAATQPTWPGVQAALLQLPAAAGAPPPPSKRVRGKPATSLHRQAVDFPVAFSVEYGSLSLWRPIQQDMRARAERRLAAVALAVQLYRADHGGDWPASLAPLVPYYLPALPTDPYATDGRPIGYRVIPRGRPDGADRPVVYDISEDGKDQLATDASWLPPAPNPGWVSGANDQWRDLTRWVPPRPTTQPGN